MSLILQSVSVLLLLTYTLDQYLSSPHSSTKEIPGPFHTRYTSLALLLHVFRGRRRVWIHQLHQTYGPVVRLGPKEVSVTGGEALKEVYCKGGGWEKGRFYELFRIGGRRTMFSTLGKFEHVKRKRYIAGCYAKSQVHKDVILDGIRDLARIFVGRCNEGKEVDIYVLLHAYALDCASHFIFGKYGTHSLEKGEDERMMRELSFHYSLRQNLIHHHFPILAKLLGPYAEPRPTPLTNTYVENTIHHSDAGNHTLLHALQTASEDLGPKVIAAESLDHLTAGIDTTGDSLCFLMYNLSLAENRHIQKRLCDEILENKAKDVEELRYIEAVIMEGLRLWPAIPMTQPRVVPKGGVVLSGSGDSKGWFLGQGVVVGAQAWSVHRLDEDVFPEAEKFRPERWLDKERRSEMEKCFLAFGMGSRGCTGRSLALAEKKTLLRAIYSKFTTKIVEGMESKWMEVEDQIISSRPRGQKCLLVFEERKFQ